MNKSESKYFNTAVRMDEALLALLTRKDFDYITVKDVCTQAGVHRSTFYLHYENTSDLLQECAERFFQQLIGCFKRDAGEFIRAIPDASMEQLILITPEYLLPYLRFIRENKTVFLTIYRNNAAFRLDAVFQRLSAHILQPIMDRFGYRREEQPLFLQFYLQGVVAVILAWIQNGCRETEAEIAAIIIRCILPNGTRIALCGVAEHPSERR